MLCTDGLVHDILYLCKLSNLGCYKKIRMTTVFQDKHYLHWIQNLHCTHTAPTLMFAFYSLFSWYFDHHFYFANTKILFFSSYTCCMQIMTAQYINILAMFTFLVKSMALRMERLSVSRDARTPSYSPMCLAK